MGARRFRANVWRDSELAPTGPLAANEPGTVLTAAERTALAPGLAVPVARTGHLIAMKLLSESPQRPQDRVDLVRLASNINAAEIALAEAAVALIDARGFSRGRDLAALLEELRSEFE